MPNPAVGRVFEDRTGQIKAVLGGSSIADIGAEKISLSRQLDHPPISSESFMIERDKQGRWWWGKPPNELWARFKEPVVRLRSGRDLALAEFFSAAVADTFVHFYEDETGKLWVSKGDGYLYRADATRPGKLNFESFTTDFELRSSGPLMISDRVGIWVATVRGVSRFDPRAERNNSRPSPIYLSRVNIAGEDLLLPETGAGHIPQIDLAAARNNLSIEFVALSFQGEDSLSYQYRLEGVDADWSAPTKSRFVNYARLAPGAYRFLVRAINKEGEPSRNPAAFDFHILPPLYQRWWVVSLAAVMILV